MAVLMIGEVPALTAEMYNGMIDGLKPTLLAANGFIAHAGGPSPQGGWRVVEMWDTEEEGQAWFEENVRPNLPPGVVPQRTFYPVDAAFSK
jgi:hypothetical protein